MISCKVQALAVKVTLDDKRSGQGTWGSTNAFAITL